MNALEEIKEVHKQQDVVMDRLRAFITDKFDARTCHVIYEQYLIISIDELNKKQKQK